MRDSTARRGGIVVPLMFLLVLGAIVAAGYYYYPLGDQERVAVEKLIVEPVSSGPFDHIVLEQGEIESSRNTEIVCRVKSRGSGGTSILWVADEGTPVKKGDKLCELDSSSLEQERKQQRIALANAEAAMTTAEALLEQAKIAREEYLQGVFMNEKRVIESEIDVAQQDLRKAKLALESAERMAAKGAIRSLQLEADQFAVANAENQLEAAQGRLRVLEELTRRKMLVQFDSDISAATANLEAARGTFEEEQEKMEEINQQIAACVMTAPVDGVVVHANRYSSRGNAETVIEAGATVRERQAIIRLPDPSLMQVKATINESRITLVKEGMPARISVGAVPGLELIGRVVKVNRYAEPGSWFSSSIKKYATIIEIVDPPESIRTGMTAEVRIFVEQLPEALQVPVQSIYEVQGTTLALVRKPGGVLETRTVKVGANNDKKATILEGLQEGEQVVLNLRENIDLLKLPEMKIENNTDLVAYREVPAEAPGKDDSGEEADPAVAGFVQRILDRNDGDSDGSLSAEEIAAIEGPIAAKLSAADTDGDGTVTTEELSKAAKKIIASFRGGRGGPPGSPRGPGGPG